MWIVRLALRRPYTFVVLSLLIFILGISATSTTPKDIFPNIDIPVISVIYNYNGLSAEDMANRIITISERSMTTTVNDIDHMESQSYNGVGVIRVYFHPNVKIDLAIAQVTAISQTNLRFMPPGTLPPQIVKYDASSVPVLQLGLSGEGLSEQQLYDLGFNFIKTQLATVQGATIPPPYGGKQAQIMVDLFPKQLDARHLSPADASNALSAQNLILPAGSAKMGDREYLVGLNSSPLTVAGLNDLPIRAANGAVVLMKDVAQVRNGYLPQTNLVRANGTPSALLTVLRNGQASTLDIVKAIKAALPRVEANLPKALQITPLFDQSRFVRASIDGVVREAVIAALLTALMILVFLGSWRSTLIVCTSIPLSILTSQIILSALGESINIMTLGGMALAVGILVDDATVEIENVHRNMAMKKPLTRAILDGAQQIAVPTFISTLSICIVFLPVVLLTGAARYLFTPLALAVVFAMLASYVLSRTLVPTMVHYMLGPEVPIYASEEGAHGSHRAALGWIWRIHFAFNDYFEIFRERYRRLLAWTLRNRRLVLALFAVFVVATLLLIPFIGQDFFPSVDAGQMQLHVRCPAGTRIEATAQVFAQVEAEIRRLIPPDEVQVIIDNIGLPIGTNMAFSVSPTISSADGEILIALNPGRHGPTQDYVRRLRTDLAAKFPEEQFFFTPADMTTQILNFGLPAPIDVQVVGRDAAQNYAVAQRLLARIRQVPGVADAHVQQVVDHPGFSVTVDRAKAQQLGLTQENVAQNVLISLSGSYQTAPNQWLNPANSVNYQVTVQTPQRLVDSVNTLLNTPIAATGGTSQGTQLLSNVASLQRSAAPDLVSHYNVQPVYDILCNMDRRDLGGVAADIQKILDTEARSGQLPRGSWLVMRGQVETMRSSFQRLEIGIGFAVLLVFLLMVVDFQSWLDPFIVLTAFPGALAGTVWSLFITQTTFSIPSLMGIIMSVGVAHANSTLLVVFANDERAAGKGPLEAALSAGYTRLRPVCMTALAMITGMLPMALALGEGGAQNAPLGRAVIGGLLVATLTTLLIVPVCYTLFRKKAPIDWDKAIDLEWHEPLPESGSHAA
ncbi:MAG: efflux RND transporter permease subunit [Candidatus Methylomirabilales bacterium]